MNEKEQNTQPEKTGLDEKKKTALLRYIAILFAVAFVFVLLSMFAQMRDSKSTISELNQSSTSALQKAEQLQENNQELEKENAYLEGRIEELEALEERLEQAEKELKETKKQLEQTEADYEALEEETEQLLKEKEQEKNAVAEAYERLLELQEVVTPGIQKGNEAAETLLDELEDYAHLLKDNAKKLYENLIKEGE